MQSDDLQASRRADVEGAHNYDSLFSHGCHLKAVDGAQLFLPDDDQRTLARLSDGRALRSYGSISRVGTSAEF